MASRIAEVHEIVNTKVGDALGAIGHASARRPYCALCACFLCSLVSLSGVVRFKSESDTDKIWVDLDSDPKVNWEYILNTFPPSGRWVTFLFEAKESGSNALTKPVFDETWDLFGEIRNLSVKNKTLEDLCIKLPSGDCVVNGALSFFRNSQEDYKVRVSNDTDLLAALNVQRNPSTGEHVRLTDVFGSYTLEGSPKQLTAAPIFKLTFYLDPAFEDEIELWEEEACHTVVDPRKKVVTRMFSHMAVQCFGSHGLSRELSRSVSADIPLFSIAFTVLITFSSFVMGRPFRCVESRKTVAFFDSLLICWAIAGGYGFSMLCGITFTSLQQVLPFILLGIGFDDGFVIAKAFDCTNTEDPIPTRMRYALKKAGLSITITSVTDIIAFLLGATSDFPAMSCFCCYAAFSIFFIYAYHLCGFCALLAIDCQRQQAQRVDCFCCFKMISANVVHPELCGVVPTHDEQECQKEQDSDSHVPPLQENGTSSHRITCEHFLVRFTKFVLECAGCKIVVLTVFALMFGVSLWLALGKTSKDFLILDLVPDESYVRDFVHTERKYWDGGDFQSRSPPTNLLFRDMDQSDPNVQAEMLDLESEFMSLSTIDSSLGSRNWLADFRAWALEFSQSKLTSANVVQVKGKDFVAKKYFVPALKVWLQSYPPAARFKNNIVFDGDAIKASLMTFRHVTLTESEDQINCLKEMENFSKAQGGLVSNVVVSSRQYQYWHQYQIIQQELFQTIGLTLAAVLAIVLIGMGNAVAVAIVFITMLSCFVNLMACIPLMGLSLNSISMVNLVMAIGLIVDYSMHIAHCFSEQDSSLSRNQRTVLTVQAMGSPVLMGGLSTLVAVLPLAFASSQVFRVFFRMLLCIVVVGIAHGLVFLPVVLSLIGTSSPKRTSRTEWTAAP
eukprot:TRINITY_DN31492_c0_g1_i1.p1 TRINITY_DN31492_c0_g1~~TRINITY_DN31492_c0_g1_i1.p1  ORF type:complete len:907 (-),score=69.37 TRINITY_DN31492_c0_g1_i1:124-2817(-)